MSLENCFRLSTYLTLGAACLCLGCAELAYLPVVSAFTLVVGALVAVAYVGDVRRQHLSDHASNWLGGVIAAAVVLWVTYQFVFSKGLIESMDFPANLLPYLAPVLMILVPAKLFRPKNVLDHWALHGIGLMSVAMGCAMTNSKPEFGAAFGLLLVAYIVCGVWSMTLFYLYRAEAGHLVPVVERPPPVPVGLSGPSPLPAGTRFPLSGATTRWAMAAFGLALVLFLSTPRTGGSQWELGGPGRTQAVTGAPDTGSIDLTRTGRLSLSSDLAFEVRADYLTEDGKARPWNDLDVYGQRWRGAGLNYYAGGSWKRVLPTSMGEDFRERRQRYGGAPPPVKNYPPVWPEQPGGIDAATSLPDIKPALQLTFEPQVKLGQGTYLAEPVTSVHGGYGPVVSLIDKGGTITWRRARDGTVLPAELLANSKTPYLQAVALTADRDRSGYVRLDANDAARLRDVPDPVRERLKPWSAVLVRRLLPRLPAEVRNAVRDRLERGEPLDAGHYEPVAKAVQEHLARSGEFTYTLNLRRTRSDIDPVEDFLYFTRSGHCERYAAALTMILRSLGVPSQVVLGYKGCEPREGGRYVVRQSHAHAWTEVLVPAKPPPGVRPAPAAAAARPAAPADPLALALAGEDTPAKWEPPGVDPFVWQWVSLDATPADDNSPGSELAVLGEWLDGVLRAVQDAFKQFIVDYDVNRRDKARSQLWETFWASVDATKARLWRGDPFAWAVLLGIVLGTGVGLKVVTWLRSRARRSRAARRAARIRADFHDRLLAVLAKIGLRPRPVQTQLEFAAAVRPALVTRTGSEELAEVPRVSARLHNRVRYGERPLEPDEQRAIEADIERLAAARPPR